MLELDPALAGIWVQYGHSLKEQGLVVDAEDAYRRALSLEGNNFDTCLHLGHVLKVQGKYIEALNVLEAGLRLNSDETRLKTEFEDIRSLMERERAQHRLEENIETVGGDEIVSGYNRILKAFGDESTVRSLDEVAKHVGISKRALDIFDHEYYFVSNKGPDLPDLTSERASCLYHFGKTGIDHLRAIGFGYEFDEGFYKKTYLNGEARDSRSAYRHWLRRGLIEQMWPNAKKFAESLLGPAAESIEHLDLDYYASKRGHAIEQWGWANALRDFIEIGVLDHSLSNIINRENIFVFIAVADRFARSGNDDAALSIYDRVLRVEPDNIHTLHKSSDVLIRKECFQAAARNLDTVIKSSSPSPWAFLNLAHCEAKLGRLDESLEITRRAMQAFPGDYSMRERFWRQAQSLTEHTWQDAEAVAEASGFAAAQRKIYDTHKHLSLMTAPKKPAAPKPVKAVALYANRHLPQCTFYRVDQKAEQLKNAGFEVRIFDQDHGLHDFMGEAHKFQAAIFYRVPALPDIVRAINYAKSLGIATFYEIDDQIFDGDLYPPPFENYAGMVTRNDYRGLALGVPLFRVALEMCDFAIGSTPALVSQLERCAPGKRVYMHRNGLDSRHRRVYLGAEPRYDNDKVTVFYGSGTKAHKEDFNDLIEPALIAAHKSYPGKIRLLVCGYIPDVYRLRASGVEIVEIPGMLEAENFWTLLRSADINVAVLKPGKLTNTKSEIKWLEAAMLGIPSIVSRTQTYEEILTDREDGLLCSTLAEWESAFKYLISSPDTRQKIGSNALRKALARYSEEHMEHNIKAVLDDACARRQEKKKKRILIVNVFYPPQAIGGATRVVHDNVRDIVEDYSDEFELEVVCSVEGGDKPYLVRSYSLDGVRVHSITTPDRPDIDRVTVDPEMGATFGTLLDAINPDVIHFHCIQRLTLSVVNEAFTREIPYIVTVHDGWWISPNQFLLNDVTDKIEVFEYSKAMERITGSSIKEMTDAALMFSDKHAALKSAFKVASVSKSFAKIYEGTSLHNVVTIANGLPKIPHIERSRRDDHIVRIGFIGGISKHKGYNYARNSFINTKFRNISLIVIDHGAEPGSVRHECWGETPVEFRPKVKQSEIGNLFADMDVLLAPSIWPESFGLVTREANLCGVWVIASDRGAIGEDVIDGVNGFKIDVSSPESLVAVLSEIDANPERFLESPPRLENPRLSRAQAREIAALYREACLAFPSRADESCRRGDRAPR
ncbi:glycosyltransferase [Swaminathania salitolerans LMG 21291]|nr:glycosyltransferase [Swaminathania salitolerans LMG 21291]